MKKVFGITLGFIGTVIGAGFASGKEIILYFNGCSFLTPILGGGFIGIISYIFAELGRKTEGNIFLSFGKWKPLFVFFVYLGNFVVFCTTLSGSEEVLFDLFSFHGGAVITALISLVLVLFGRKSKILEVCPVLVIIALTLFLFIKGTNTLPTGKISPLSAFRYAGMNMLSGGFFIAGNCKDITRKQSVQIGILSGVTVSALLLAVFALSSPYAEQTFPFIAAATKEGAEKAGLIILYLSMITTCTGTTYVLTKKEVKRVLCLTSLALVVCCLGFTFLVETVYPVIGTIGGIIVFICIARYIYDVIPDFFA